MVRYPGLHLQSREAHPREPAGDQGPETGLQKAKMSVVNWQRQTELRLNREKTYGRPSVLGVSLNYTWPGLIFLQSMVLMPRNSELPSNIMLLLPGRESE